MSLQIVVLKVTQEDIDLSRAQRLQLINKQKVSGERMCCPIERAAMRHFETSHVWTGYICTVVGRLGTVERTVFEMDSAAEDFVERFDRNEAVGPLTVTLIQRGDSSV